MKIVCPSCRVPVAADDVNLTSGLAKCRTCNNIFRFDDSPELAPAANRARPPAGRPSKVVCTDTNGTLTVSYPWFSWKYIILALFCVFWDGFLIFWYGAAFKSGNLIMILFPILHLVAGVAVTAATIAGFVNHTTMRIDGSRLTVRHHPIPMGRKVDLALDEIQQLFCDERITRGRNGVSYTYNLNVLMKNGMRKRVISGLDSADMPLFLEQHAEQWMKLPDAPVAGELPR